MKNNKGFSLVELIIVIAIMAILAAAIAPALIRYINKARIADDLTAAGEIVSACNTAMTNEDANDFVVASPDFSVKFEPNGKITVSGSKDPSGKGKQAFTDEIKATLPNGAKKKYVKDGSDGYYVEMSKDQFIVYAAKGGSNTGYDQLNPSATGSYAQ